LRENQENAKREGKAIKNCAQRKTCPVNVVSIGIEIRTLRETTYY